jgi:hypothetical protein
VTRLSVHSNGGSGETPEPTVKVWMGEGKKFWFMCMGEVYPFLDLYLTLPFF